MKLANSDFVDLLRMVFYEFINCSKVILDLIKPVFTHLRYVVTVMNHGFFNERKCPHYAKAEVQINIARLLECFIVAFDLVQDIPSFKFLRHILVLSK